MDAVIQFLQAGKQYQSHWALEPLTLSVAPGEFLSIVGSSGGGKTTLLKLINGLLLPSTGKVLVLGQDTAQVDLIALRRQIGYVIQGAALFPHLSIADNINYVPALSGTSLSQAQLARLMAMVDLPLELLERYPISLSGGQQQRVGIARALANNPPIMLMDEPFGHLDAQTRYMMEEELQRIWQKEKRTVIFVTNNIEEALFLADRIILLTNCPTHIKEEYVIDMPHPRDYVDPEFLRLRQLITDNMDLTL